MSELQLEDVRVIKISTGETLIGFLQALSDELEDNPQLDNYVLVRSAYKVEYEVSRDENGEPNMIVDCVKWMPFVQDDALLIQKHNIIATGVADNDLLNCYANLIEIEVFGTYQDEEEN